MEKIKHSALYKFKPVKIYYNDLENILQIYETVNNNIGSDYLEISTNDYYFSDLSEIKKSYESKKINYLHIKCQRISLYLEETECKLYIDDIDDIQLIGAAEKIKKLLKKHESKFYSLLINKPISNILPALSGVIITILITFIIKSEMKLFFSVILSVYIFGVVIYQIFYYKTYFREYSTIYLINKEEKDSFFKRKKDDIILIIISTLFGGVFGSIITLIITKLIKWNHYYLFLGE